MPEIQGGSFDPRRAFTRSAALTNGVNRGSLEGPAFRRLFRGYYIAAGTSQADHQRILAAVLIHPPGAFASHRSAARLYGLPLPPDGDQHVTVTCNADRRPRNGIRCHVKPGPTNVATRQGIPVSTPVDTFLALAQLLSLVDLVEVGDAMVAGRLATPEGLVDAAELSHERGAKLARRAACLVRPGVDSPKLIVEYDGRQHAENTRQWRRDIARREFLEARGWTIIVVTSTGIFGQPADTLQSIANALKRRGHLAKPRQSAAWRPHFPSE